MILKSQITTYAKSHLALPLQQTKPPSGRRHLPSETPDLESNLPSGGAAPVERLEIGSCDLDKELRIIGQRQKALDA